MAKILLVNPNKWGRGITTIWIASHAGYLKKLGHSCELFDCTFFSEWSENETSFNTANSQYQPTQYENFIEWNQKCIYGEFQKVIDSFDPDVIFSSAISSHIHGEGEYSSIQHYHQLVSEVETSAVIIAGGLQPTADVATTAKRFPLFNYLIAGESEVVLGQFVDDLVDNKDKPIPGLVKSLDGNTSRLTKQPIIDDLDVLGSYDYSIFPDQVFWRPYNGTVVRAVDYELSRGCLFTCSYCVETVIQRYYGFSESSKRGALTEPKKYIRTKTAENIFSELQVLESRFNVDLVRSQDTNFLTIPGSVLTRLADLVENSTLSLRLYIETRPEGINTSTIRLLKRLNVDGVGMGIEAADEQYRESDLHRYANQEKIIRAFRILRENGIKATAYNVIGFPGQTEKSIIDTIKFNQKIEPDNITVAFYSPFQGTDLQRRSAAQGLFDEYSYSADPQLRTKSIEDESKITYLRFYKKYFVPLVRDGLENLDDFKNEFLRSQT